MPTSVLSTRIEKEIHDKFVAKALEEGHDPNNVLKSLVYTYLGIPASNEEASNKEKQFVKSCPKDFKPKTYSQCRSCQWSKCETYASALGL